MRGQFICYLNYFVLTTKIPYSSILGTKKWMIFIIFGFLNLGLLYSQNTYQLTGDAANAANGGPDCYRLTADVNSQAGAAWNTTQIDLSCDFNWTGTFSIGFQGGADGMAFVLQNTGTNVNAQHGLTGTPNISPSFTVEFDPYENNNSCSNPPSHGDPCGGCSGANADHVSIYKNADAVNALVPAFCVPTIANGSNHSLEIDWSANTQVFSVKIDGANTISYQGDLVNDIFGGNSMVYYGFAARTGGANNIQRFCHTSSSNDNCCPTDRGFVD